MVTRVSKKTKRWLIRISISIIASPLIIFLVGILSPTPANAEEASAQIQGAPTPPLSDTVTVTTSLDSTTVVPVDSTTTSTGGVTNSTQNATTPTNASEEVIQPAAPVVSTQDPITAAATAVATAGSNLVIVNQDLQEVVTQAGTLVSTPAITDSVNTAVQSVATATQAITDANTAIQIVEIKIQEATDATAASNAADAAVVVAQGDVVLAQTTADTAIAAVAVQLPVVATAQTNVNTAQAVVDTNTSLGLHVDVYNVAGQNNAPILPVGATPIGTFTDTNGISEQWGGGAVAGSNRVDDVIVIYTGQLTYQNTGTSWYTAQADDGTKVYLNGALVASDWYDKGGGGSTITVQTIAGQVVPFQLWYYENGGGAAVQFLRYTTNGWVVETNFSTSSATPEQHATLDTAQQVLSMESATLTALQDTANQTQTTLTSAQTTLTTAINTATSAETTEQTAIQQVSTAKDTAIQLTQIAVQQVQDAQTAVAASQIVVNIAQEQSVINPPTNVQVEHLLDGSIKVTWTAPVGGATVERYAVSWSTDSGGWGVASTTTSIILAPQLFETTGGWTTYTFSVRSDNDTRSMYSTSTIVTGVQVTDPTPPPTIPNSASILSEGMGMEVIAPKGQKIASITAWYGDPADSSRGIDLSSQLTQQFAGATSANIVSSNEFGDPAGGTVKILIFVVTYENIPAVVPPVELPTPPAEPQTPVIPKIPVDPTLEIPVDPTPETPIQPEEPLQPTQPEEPTQPEQPVVEPETPVVEPTIPAEPVMPVPQPEIPVDPTPVEPVVSVVTPEPTPENIISDALADGKLTTEEKVAVISAILEDLKPGEAVSVDQLLKSGLTFGDLPPETPVDVRTDENGNAVVITAEVAEALTLLADPAALIGAIFSDPSQALMAIGNIGADMSPAERAEAEKMVVATVVAAGAAMNAAAVAASGGSSSGGSSRGSGSSPSPRGGGDGGAPVGKEGGTTRKPKTTKKHVPKKPTLRKAK